MNKPNHFKPADWLTLLMAAAWLALVTVLLAAGGCVEWRPIDDDDVTPTPGNGAIVIIEEYDERNKLTSTQADVILQNGDVLAMLDAKFPGNWRQWDDDHLESQFANEAEVFKSLYFPKPASVPWVRAVKGKKKFDGPLEGPKTIEEAAKKIGIK